MKAVNIAELATHLSLYLDEVKAGEEIEVLDSDQLIALIVPPPRAEQDDQLLALAAEGKVRLGEGTLDDSFWDLPAPEVSMEVLQRAIEEDRNED